LEFNHKFWSCVNALKSGKGPAKPLLARFNSVTLLPLQTTPVQLQGVLVTFQLLVAASVHLAPLVLVYKETNASHCALGIWVTAVQSVAAQTLAGIAILPASNANAIARTSGFRPIRAAV
jgi:hypothetical protein